MLRLTRISSLFCSQPKQKIILIFGPPGVGKGTYSKMLMKDLQLNHISTGDEIRKILKTKAKGENAAKLEKIKAIVKSGGLVSDEIVLHIIQDKMKEPESKRGVILDGFPRTITQLDKLINSFSAIHLVINLTLREDVLIEKLMGRRMCMNCGASFNVCDIQRNGYFMEPMLPKKEGVCDNCGGKLIIRDDDSKKVIGARMKEYNDKTMPLLEKFRSIGILCNFEPKNGVKDYSKLKDLICK